MNTSESIAKLAPALIKAQGAMKAVEKTNSNDFHRYTYADLGDIKRTVDGPLQDNGLALVVSEPEVVAGAPRETIQGPSESCMGRCNFFSSTIDHTKSLPRDPRDLPRAHQEAPKTFPELLARPFRVI